MKKKIQKKEEETPVVPKNQMLRLKKLFSASAGRESTQVNHSRLN
ncbi:Uncharacterised protein [uncultured archaeon]|nr:Uncharacterised protein [uncultured archaeon]